MQALFAAYVNVRDEEDGDPVDSKPAEEEKKPEEEQPANPPTEDGPIEVPSVELLAVNAAPKFAEQTTSNFPSVVDYSKGYINFNPKVEQLFVPLQGPAHPFHRGAVAPGQRNIITGFVQDESMSDFAFHEQFQNFVNKGYAVNPANPYQIIGVNAAKAGELEAQSSMKPNKKRKKAGDSAEVEPEKDPGNVEGYRGPWKEREETVSGAPGAISGGESKEEKVEEEEKKEEEEDEEPSKKRQKKVEEEAGGIFHGPYRVDSLGRSWLAAPKDLKYNGPDDKCYLPKRIMYTWKGHSKGVSRVQLFPKTAHMLLSASMDGTVKIWDVHNKRSCLMTYVGHYAAVRDICFNYDGTKFISASYDKDIRLWDTETGKCLGTFSTKRVPYVCKFHPSDDNVFLVGQSDKKIVQWNIKDNKTEQEYDRHLGAVNTITFIDEGRRFVSTSDDKSIRVWEFGIPVEIKYIAEPHMHSMPAVTVHPNGKWMLMQSMDNQILCYSTQDKFRLNRKKRFTGHVNAGFAINPGVSPDGHYVISGDGEGRLWIWDWKTTKMLKRIPCHSQVLIDCVWHPHSTSKVITASWDGTMHLLD